MTESMDNNQPLPSINLEGSKSSDSYEINVNVLIVIVVILVLLGIGFFFWRSRSTSETVSPVTPTPTMEVVTTAPTEVVTSTPTPTMAAKGSPTATPKATPKPTSANATPKEKTLVNVLNGTGATGDAGFLKNKLVADGYSSDNIKTGNGSSPSAEADTKVVFYQTFPAELKIDLVSLLNTLYASVSSSLSTAAGEHDVVITTGKKK